MMRKYWRLLQTFARYSFMADIEYRANIALKVFADFFWYAAQISVYQVIFSKISSFAGWDIHQIMVFLGVLFVGDAFYMILFSENLDQLSNKIAKGDLDLLLVKPVNSQFMLSFQKWNTAYVFNGLAAFVFLAWALHGVGAWSDPLTFFKVILVIPLALSITYFFRLFFAALAFVFIRAESLNWVWYQIYRLGTRPDSIYPSWLRYFILTVFPVGLMVSLPTRLILGMESTWMWGITIVVPLVFVALSRMYWSFVLRKYTSASS